MKWYPKKKQKEGGNENEGIQDQRQLYVRCTVYGTTTVTHNTMLCNNAACLFVPEEASPFSLSLSLSLFSLV